MPGKTARALCPVCQEPMPPDETECDNCGAFVIDEAVVRLSRAFGIPREKALALFEKGFRHPRQIGNRDVDDVLERGENGLLFLCTNCGGFVATADVKCPRCGAEFESEAPEPAGEEKDILDLVLCPVCGADNEPAWKECEICGEPLGGTEEPPGAPAAAATTAAASPAPEAAAKPPSEEATDVDGLERIDDILKDLETTAASVGKGAIRPIPRSPKRTKKRAPEGPRPVPPARPTPTQTSGAPKPSATPTTRPAAKPVPAAISKATEPSPKRPVASPWPTPAARPPASRALPRPRSARPALRTSPPATPHRWTVPPPEFTAGLVLAAAAGLYTSMAFGEDTAAWGIAGVLVLLVLILLGICLSRREDPIVLPDVLLLAAGAGAGAGAPVLHATFAPLASAASAVLLGVATRRLIGTPNRDFLIAASGVPLAALGVVAAQGRSFATTPAFAFGLLAAALWPAAVLAVTLRSRRTSVAARQEIAKAERNLQRQDYAASVKGFDRAIALGTKGSPGEELPWYGKGASLLLLGQYEEALRAIDKALDLNPRNEVAWLNKGNALTRMGRLADALRCFNAAITVNPTYEVAWNNKGNALARLGHYDEALACYERALELDGDYRGAWMNKGYVLTKIGRYEEATACADRVMRLKERAQSRAA